MKLIPAFYGPSVSEEAPLQPLPLPELWISYYLEIYGPEMTIRDSLASAGEWGGRKRWEEKIDQSVKGKREEAEWGNKGQ